MGLGKIRKYRQRVRFDPAFRGHHHGWDKWTPPRIKRMSPRKLWRREVREEARKLPPIDPDNWEDIVRVLDFREPTQAPEGV